MRDRHPLWNPYDLPTIEQIDAASIGGRRELIPGRRLEVVPTDPAWPRLFEQVAARIRSALGGRALEVAHVGSTSVPGLAAKPVIDVDVTVEDSSDEAAWLPPLEAVGFRLEIREPEWEEHRCLVLEHPRVNAHVWSRGAREPQRHALFRDHLTSDTADREAYGRVKLELAEQDFDSVMEYNNAKAAVIYDVYEHAFAADPAHAHEPVPRSG